MTLARKSLARPSNHLTWIVAVNKRRQWFGPLTNFVRESAWVHSLYQVEPIGWDASLADHLGHFSTSSEAYAAFRQTISGAIERGRIEVRVPPILIRQWEKQYGHNQDASRSVGTQAAR